VEEVDDSTALLKPQSIKMNTCIFYISIQS
jgi:hypothetical protein